MQKKYSISVPFSLEEMRRLDKAAQLMKQSMGTFLEKAGAERARKVLLEWVVSRYQQGEASLSELAEETGLKIEEIVDSAGHSHGGKEAIRRAQAIVRKYVPPGRSLSDELIAERRREAQRAEAPD